jgi:protein O-mannosyl-transferase
MFWPTVHAGWVDWDDPTNFLNNPYYRGLGWPQLRWMLTTSLLGHWIPVTWMTLAVDYAIWGMNPAGYHLGNLLWHAGSVALFYLVSYRLITSSASAWAASARALGATASALFFAIHPLRVESVAWITERRDLTSGFFFFLTILCYLNAHIHGRAVRRRWYVGSVVSGALALASKSVVMGLPLALVILDFYPLRRLSPNFTASEPSKARSIWREKVPFVLFSVAAGTVAYHAQSAGGHLGEETLTTRVAMAGYSFWFHAWKTLIPRALSPLYESPAHVSVLDPTFLLPTVAVVGITGMTWLLRRRWPAALAVWGFYLVMLAPVSGLVHTGYHLGADRNSYISCAGFAVLVGALVAWIREAWNRRMVRPSLAAAALVLCAAWLATLAAITRIQVPVWHDSDALWRRAIEIDPRCSVCWQNLAISLAQRGRYAESLAGFQQAMALRPERSEFHGNYGLLLAQLGRRAEGITELRYRLRHSSGDLGTRTNLGLALLEEGHIDDAIGEFETVIRIDPRSVPALVNLGRARLSQGRIQDAAAAFERAVSAAPNYPVARLGLARAHLAGGDRAGAYQQFVLLRRLDPAFASQFEREFR